MIYLQGRMPCKVVSQSGHRELNDERVSYILFDDISERVEDCIRWLGVGIKDLTDFSRLLKGL